MLETPEDRDPRNLAAELWFGYGRWDAKYWFVGMEPGGDDEHSSYESWLRLDPERSGLIDCRGHHLCEEHPGWHRWHEAQVPPIQPTWGPLIRALLAFENMPTDHESIARYQREPWGSAAGETAVIELSALHAAHLGVDVERTLCRSERIARIREEMERHKPRFAIFYGRTYRAEYEKIAGSFGSSGWTWSGDTLCVLIAHPTRRTPWPKGYWDELGAWLRSAIKAGPGSQLPPMPDDRWKKLATAAAPEPIEMTIGADGSQEYEIQRGGRVVGRVLYDGWHMRVERRLEGGGFELIGYYENTRADVQRKFREIDAIFDEWAKMRSADPERVKVSWRRAEFVPDFAPPEGALQIGCSVVLDDGVPIAHVYKLRQGAIWSKGQSVNLRAL